MLAKTEEKETKKTNLDRLQEEVFKGRNLEWQASRNLGPDFQYIEDSKAWYTNRKGTDVVYVQPKTPGDAMATCYGCGSYILGKNQRVTEWDRGGPGPFAGNEVRTQLVRYCPTCELEPSNFSVEKI